MSTSNIAKGFTTDSIFISGFFIYKEVVALFYSSNFASRAGVSETTSPNSSSSSGIYISATGAAIEETCWNSPKSSNAGVEGF